MTSALVCCSSSIALASPGLTFTEALTVARKKDSALAASQFAVAATEERVVQANAALRPNVNSSGNLSRQWSDSSNVQRTEQFNSASFTLSMSYPLYRLPAKETLIQSRLSFEQAKLQSIAADQELILRVAQNYLNVLAAMDTLRAAQAQRRAAMEQLASIRKSFDAGNAPRIDMQDAQARSDISQTQELAARNELEVKRGNLQVLTGLLNPELRRLRPGINLDTDSSYGMNDWVRQSRTANPQVLQAELALETAQAEVRKQSASSKPTVDLVSSVTAANSPNSSLIGVRQNSAQLGIQLNFPIYSGGALGSKTKEAVALFNKASADLESAREQVELTTRQAVVRISSGRSLIRALDSAVTSSQDALETTIAGFRAGARVNLDVLNAQQQLFQQRRDLAKARYDFLLDSLRLKALTGGLSDEDLSRFDRLLAPLESN